MRYPLTRLRRVRKTEWSRALVAESSLSIQRLILPLFIQGVSNNSIPIPSMPGISRLSISSCIDIVRKAEDIGISAVLLFPHVPQELKTDCAREAYNPNNLICNAIRAIKKAALNIGIIADVALDPYTSHGHDGILGYDVLVDNERTLDVICKQAVALAEAGCDVIAPSEMMDGRVLAIRRELEARSFYWVQIMSYAVKYASSFYSPFREAVGSKRNAVGTNSGLMDKRNYQMDPANASEAILEIGMDIDEGADMVVIKPAMPYLDIVQRAAATFSIPIVAYQVSGEYSMLKFATLNNALDYKSTMLEALIACKRAGARSIITYAALEVAQWLGV